MTCTVQDGTLAAGRAPLDCSDTRAGVGSHIFVKAKLNLTYVLKVIKLIIGPLHFETLFLLVCAP